VFRYLVTVIAGPGQGFEAGIESLAILRFYGGCKTVQRLVDHRYVFDFRSVRTVGLQVIQRLFNLVYFKVRQFPVIAIAGKPEFGVVDLDAAHEFSESRLISAMQLLLQGVNLYLEGMVIRHGLAGNSKYKWK
jgi:hypothetical protein